MASTKTATNGKSAKTTKGATSKGKNVTTTKAGKVKSSTKPTDTAPVIVPAVETAPTVEIPAPIVPAAAPVLVTDTAPVAVVIPAPVQVDSIPAPVVTPVVSPVRPVAPSSSSAARSEGSGVNLFGAHRQWATRPADQRFWTLEAARDYCAHYADTAQELEVDFGRSALVAGPDDNIRLALADGREATLTNWAFGQLAKTANAPADYIRKLPADLAIRCVEHGLDQHFAGRADGQMTRSALVHQNGSTVLRSLTSDRYSRFWNHKVFSRCVDLQAHGWRVPPARPCGDNTPAARPATQADCLADQWGMSIKPGDMIAPAGVYASDHDMFAFMVHEGARIEDGSDGGLSRGFFVSNSEVGAAALKVTMFGYRHVCGNHIVWGAEDVIEVSVRHLGDVAGRFELELVRAVESYAAQSAAEETARIRRAKMTVLGKTDDEVLDAVFKAFTKTRKYNLPSGMSVKVLARAVDTAKVHETTDGNPYSVWGVVNGLTRVSQATPYADERNFLDRAAAAVLGLAV